MEEKCTFLREVSRKEESKVTHERTYIYGFKAKDKVRERAFVACYLPRRLLFFNRLLQPSPSGFGTLSTLTSCLLSRERQLIAQSPSWRGREEQN